MEKGEEFGKPFGFLPQKIQQTFRLHSAKVDGKKCLLYRLGNSSCRRQKVQFFSFRYVYLSKNK